MQSFPHILRTVRTGTYLSATRPSRSSRCPELASSYYLCHYRPTSACFCHRLYTSARRLPAAPACPLLQPARCSARSACSAVPASLPATCLPPACHLPATCLPPARRSAALPVLPAPASQPARRLLCPLQPASQPACLPAKKSETFQSLAFLLSGLGLRQPPPDFLRVSPENLPGRAARGS